MTDINFTAYCGLYCGDCIRFRSRASGLAGDLLRELKKTQFSEYAKVKQLQIPEFAYYETMVNLLVYISELQCETPCRMGGDGCIGSCSIIRCVKDKSFEGCWECSQYNRCDKLDFLKHFHGDTPILNLDRIKEFGISRWAKYRGKIYPWLA